MMKITFEWFHGESPKGKIPYNDVLEYFVSNLHKLENFHRYKSYTIRIFYFIFTSHYPHNKLTKKPNVHQMDRQDRELVDDLLADFVEDVIPADMLPYLTCLTADDKEEIRSEENSRGHRRAAVLLIDRLKRRKNGFVQFLRALERTGCSHLVDLIILKQDGLLPSMY